MGRRCLMIVVAILLVWIPGVVYADGGLFVHEFVAIEGFHPSQSAQQALLIWKDGIETLHLQSNYSGPNEDFSWVIPVPSKPTVTPSSWHLFQEAEAATRPYVELIRQVFKPGFGCGCSVAVHEEPGFSVEMGVTLLESLDIQELHLDILSAKDSGGLVHWLQLHDYAVPDHAYDILHE